MNQSDTVSFFEDEYTRPLTLVERPSKTPRFYQSNAVSQTNDYLEGGFRRILIKSPTGTGKTFISKILALSASFRKVCGVEDGEVIRILFISNKHRLNRQAINEYKENYSIELITHSAFSPIPDHVLEKIHATYIDECQHEAMLSIQMLLDGITVKPIIGFTADDNRGDNLLLKFERVVVAISEYDAAFRGFTEKVGINTIIDTGTTDKSRLACQIIEQYHRHIGNAIAFFRTEREVIRVFNYARRLGLKVAMLGKDSKESDMDRELDRLSSGDIQFLFNCQRVGEGIDAANITDVLLFRQFLSAQEKKQYVGRAIRPDSPCAIWEMINPLNDSITTKSVVGISKYERLIYLRKGEWFESMISGEDKTWGDMRNIAADLSASFKDEMVEMITTKAA